MKSLSVGATPVDLRTGTGGSVRTGARRIGEHNVVAFTIEGDLRALSQADGLSISAACELARAKGTPVVGFIQSTGADVLEGITAAHGWGSAARAMIRCSGIVPTVLVVTGPVVAGPAFATRDRRFCGHDRRRHLCVRLGSSDG